MKIKTIDSSEFRELSDIEHAIKRATIYIGSTKTIEAQQYAFFEDGKIHPEMLEYVQGSLVLASELINNAYDEYVKRRSDKSRRNIDTIDVVVDLQRKSLTVRDNGGIPIALHADSGLLLPSFLFGRLRTGSNYDDESRADVGGLNGMGAMLVNLFSKAFHVKVFDDNESKYFQQTWRNSSRETLEYDANKDPNSVKQLLHDCKPQNGSVEIIAEFDTDMLPASAYSLSWARIIEMRCALIAAMATNDAPLTVNFTCIPVDGEIWHRSFRFKHFEDYIALYPNSDSFIIDRHDKFTVAMSLSNGAFESIGSVNGLRCDRGTHIHRFTQACAFHIREHIQARHHVDIKPAKIISAFKMLSIFRVNAPDFGGQTKEELVTDLRDLGYNPIPSERFIRDLLRSSIVKQLVEELHHQILAKRKQELAKREREQRKLMQAKVFSPKLTDAALAGKAPGCTLYIVEGDSAAGGFVRSLSNDGKQGVYAMQGKSMGNVIYDDEIRVSERPSFDGLMQAAGLSMVRKPKLRYDNFVLAQDADMDGNCITALTLVFIVKFFPWLIQQGRVYKLLTPAVIASKGKEIKEYYYLQDYEADKAMLESERWQIKYHKGLSQIKPSDFERMMKNPKLIQIKLDEDADLSMHTWFGKAHENKAMRKDYLTKSAGFNADAEVIDIVYDAELSELSGEDTETLT